MFTKYFAKQKFIHFALLTGTALLLLTACDSGNTSQQSNAPTPTSTTVKSASAIIRHSPSGLAELSWDNKSHTLMVHVALTGLSPRSVHPAHISAGSCKNGGKSVYDLNTIKADTIGFANSITAIKDVTGGIPETGWFIDVNNGPKMDNNAQAMQISCANVFNTNASVNAPQKVQSNLNTALAPNQSVSGVAQLSVKDNELTVTMTLRGLTPNSRHSAHIHSGSCASQGDVLYGLKPVVVNAAGDGTSTTIIPNVSVIQRNGWYVNIHLGTNLGTQTSMDPVACGDITSLH